MSSLKLYRLFPEIKCPCGNKYVIEIQKTTKCETSPPRTSFLAGNIFLPTATSAARAAEMAEVASSISIERKSDDSASVPKTSHSFSSIGEFN